MFCRFLLVGFLFKANSDLPTIPTVDANLFEQQKFFQRFHISLE